MQHPATSLASAAPPTPPTTPSHPCQVRKYLHVVLCFSPVGDKFRVRARQFPALVSCTVIDCFHAWPGEALISGGWFCVVWWAGVVVMGAAGDAGLVAQAWLDSAGCRCPFWAFFVKARHGMPRLYPPHSTHSPSSPSLK